MLKIPFYKGVKESISYRNVKYGPQLYMGEKKFEWIHFIENDYEKLYQNMQFDILNLIKKEILLLLLCY